MVGTPVPAGLARRPAAREARLPRPLDQLGAAAPGGRDRPGAAAARGVRRRGPRPRTSTRRPGPSRRTPSSSGRCASATRSRSGRRPTTLRPGFEPWHLRVVTDPAGEVVAMALVQMNDDCALHRPARHPQGPARPGARPGAAGRLVRRRRRARRRAVRAVHRLAHRRARPLREGRHEGHVDLGQPRDRRWSRRRDRDPSSCRTASPAAAARPWTTRRRWSTVIAAEEVVDLGEAEITLEDDRRRLAAAELRPRRPARWASSTATGWSGTATSATATRVRRRAPRPPGPRASAPPSPRWVQATARAHGVDDDLRPGARGQRGRPAADRPRLPAPLDGLGPRAARGRSRSGRARCPTASPSATPPRPTARRRGR